WAELFIFGLRLVLVFVLTLFGWVVTLSGLARVMPDAPASAVVEPATPPPAPEPAPQESAAVRPELPA
ncbi:MAG TPA: hypothetical protein VNZ44_09970, partial [Pyrinomonadaceae bacterium]|nr:hypothetical protein [Pyrinomonadaceae bacterium]